MTGFEQDWRIDLIEKYATVFSSMEANPAHLEGIPIAARADVISIGSVESNDPAIRLSRRRASLRRRPPCRRWLRLGDRRSHLKRSWPMHGKRVSRNSRDTHPGVP
jgi:hypothetical protein